MNRPALKLLPLAPLLQGWRETEVAVARLRANLASEEEAYWDEVASCLRWRANKAVVPPHVYRDARVECPPAQERAYQEDLGVLLAAYRARPVTPDFEADAEARNVHGPGVEMVDVFSGRRWTT